MTTPTLPTFNTPINMDVWPWLEKSLSWIVKPSPQTGAISE